MGDMTKTNPSAPYSNLLLLTLIVDLVNREVFMEIGKFETDWGSSQD